MNVLKYFSIITFFCAFIIAGTDGTIRGKVTDEKGEGLPGTQIYIPGTSFGTMTDVGGNYYILNVDIKHFSENPTPYLNGFNYHSIFFSIYLNSFGANSAWVQMIDLNEPKRDLFMYTPGKFSAPFVFKNNNQRSR